MYCPFLFIKLQPEIDYDCPRDETPKLEFLYLSDKIDILATVVVQKHYFEVSAGPLCYIRAFHSVFD